MVLPYGSVAVTFTLPATPAVTVEGKIGRATGRAGAGLTVMAAWEPLMLPVTVSVAVTDCVPAVLRVTEKVCSLVPALVKVWSAGGPALARAWVSVLVKWTVPV